MGIKKKCRELNRAKNKFLSWLKDQKATGIDVYNGQDEEWDYYVNISAFVNNTLYVVCFAMWNGKVQIDYSDEHNRYYGIGIDEFYQLIS